MDTSGSVSNEEIRVFIGELLCILGVVRRELNVLWVDSQVHGHDVLEPGADAAECHPSGRGGTDFKPPFEWVDDQGECPVAAVYLTDGECDSFPDHEPAYPVLWVLTRDYAGFKPPWGEVLTIPIAAEIQAAGGGR